MDWWGRKTTVPGVACPGRREGGLDHSFEEQCDNERFYFSLLFQYEDFVVKL